MGNKELTLVVMAAGMGSRFGGLKQIEPVGPNGEVILEYSVYNAIKAGFNKVVFIIKKSIDKDFKDLVISKIEGKVDYQIAYQELNVLPAGYKIPENREKPWGTTHAVLMVKDMVKGPFAVINADDYYGQECYSVLFDYLKNTNQNSPSEYAMVGYNIENTVSTNGSVARGICKTDANNNLVSVVERLKIECNAKTNEIDWIDTDSTRHSILKKTPVSMNFWGLNSSFFDYAQKDFINFLDTQVKENPLRSECLLPTTIDKLIKQSIAKVRVLNTSDKWHGITYKEDKPELVRQLKLLENKGKYPQNLWENFK